MYATLVLKSNNVFNGIDFEVKPGYVAIGGNKILSTGPLGEETKFISANTKVCNLENNFVMPGFIDPHMHFFMGAMFEGSSYVDLSEAKSEAECVELVKSHWEKNPEIEHITGWGWFMMNWAEKAKAPNKKSLDETGIPIPIYMFCVDGHTCWINTKAMENCNINKDTIVPFGSIERDEKGELTGLLFEIAAEAMVMDEAFHISDKEWPQIKGKMLKNIASKGITSIADLSVSPRIDKEPISYAKFMDMEKNGEMTVRIHLYPSLSDDGNLEIAKEIRQKYSGSTLRLSGLKQFVDGTTSLYSGMLLEPYEDSPQTKGESNYDHETYDRLIENANKEGFDVRLHAIGDAAVRLALDSIEKAVSKNNLIGIRNSIEHCENVNPEDFKRFKELGVIASIQPTHLVLDANEKIMRIGGKRARYEWPCKSLLEAGATLAFGTDFPVYDFNPIYGLYAAVKRCDFNGKAVGASSKEAISIGEALKAYTYGAAYSLNRENELGSIESGKLADIAVLDKNPFEVPAEKLLDIKNIMTIMEGKIIYIEK